MTARVRVRVRVRVSVSVRARVGGCGEHVPALDLSRDDQLIDPGLGISPRVLVPVHVVKAIGVLRREEVLGADLRSGGHVSESRGGSAGRAMRKPSVRTLARRGGGGRVAASVSIGKTSRIMQISVITVEAPMTVQGLRPTKWPHL